MKIKIKVKIKNNEQNLKNIYTAIYQKDKEIIKYQELDKTKVTLNIKDNILIRENNFMYMKYIFLNNNISIGDILLKDINKSVKVNIKTKKIIKNSNKFLVKYELLDGNEAFEYELIKEEEV